MALRLPSSAGRERRKLAVFKDKLFGVEAPRLAGVSQRRPVRRGLQATGGCCLMTGSRNGMYEGKGRFEWRSAQRNDPDQAFTAPRPSGSFYEGDWCKGEMHGAGLSQ